MFATRRTRAARITIELDLDRPHLAGLMTGAESTRSFDGWLELTAALAAAESDARFAASGTARRAAERRAAALRVSSA